MAAILCIIDGMTDEAWFDWQRQAMPWWNRMGEQGACGFLQTTAAGQTADSVGCILRLLGYPTVDALTLRGWIEALGCGIACGDEDLLLRASWMALDEQQRCTGFAALSDPLSEIPAQEEDIAYYSMGGYKALLVVKNGARWLSTLHTVAPHQQFGAPFYRLLPSGCPSLLAYVQRHRQANRILIPWGQSCVGQLQPFSRQAIGVAGCSTMVGIGRALQLPMLQLEQATGDVDTDLSAKVTVALQKAAEVPLVLLHINGADEAGHRQNRAEKQQFLRRVDQLVLAPLYQSGHRVLVTADHGCSVLTGRHLDAAQPFVLHRGGCTGNLGLLAAEQALSLLCDS